LVEREGSAHEGRARFTAVPASSYFAGHFPGRPVLPAVAQLGIVQLALASLPGRQMSIVVVERLRCARPVLPGERLALDLDWGAGCTRVRFVFSLATDRVSDGVVICEAIDGAAGDR
ncbi:MAG: hypothetical protein ACRD0X_05185, partial [Thermoanaerobaculia bacterium]